MPEGHSIHRIARDQNKWFVDQKVAVLSPQGRFAKEAEKLSGKRLRDIVAHGKHLFYLWPRQVVHVHLGLYGKFRVFKNPAPEPKGAVRVRLIGQQKTFDLNGPNCCELISRTEMNAIRERLGEDPLNSQSDSEKVWQKFQRSRSSLGRALMDQSIIAGIGNIYRSELLFRTQLHPERPLKQVSRNEFDDLWSLTTQLMSIGVKYNRIITVDLKSSSKTPSRLTKHERTNIYKKQSCPRCQSDIRQFELAGRKVFCCDHCQQ